MEKGGGGIEGCWVGRGAWYGADRWVGRKADAVNNRSQDASIKSKPNFYFITDVKV